MKLIKTLAASAVALTLAAPAWAADIVDTAAEAGSFSTLLAAAEAAGLVDTLKGEGPFTVFAPTDEAFDALPAGTVEDLLKPENKDQLAAILTYHVVPGKVMSTDLAGKEMAAASVEGTELQINATGDAVMVEEATVVTADVEADNGVIHVIDKVMLPSS
ncbi:MAG: fasciclin domain-containing protein [Pseudomonadota bacterium]